MSIHIGIDVRLADNPFSGMGKHTTRWVEHLAELDQSNRYFLFCTREKVLPETLRRICLQRPNFSWVEVNPGLMNRLPARWSNLYRRQVLIPLAAFANRCRLILFPFFVDASFCLLPWAVLCVTDFAFFMDRNPSILIKNLLKARVWGARGLFAISKATQADTIRYTGISADRVPVIYPGVEDYFQPVAKDKARAWCLAHYGIDFPFALYTGGFADRKNLPRLLQAFNRVRDMIGNHLKLVITGKLNGNSELFRWLQDDHPAMTMQLGRVPEMDLKNLYSAAELAVYPSLYEGFGLPIIEAQACGVPVVTSNVTSMPEVAGGAAILVDPTDEEALAEAMFIGLTDQALRKNLVKEGLVNARRYTWSKGARQLQKLLEHLKPGGCEEAGWK
jgi:glycosyltransferase involved in cell wall biosynthesis